MSTSTKLQIASALAALALVSMMVMRVSSAAFSATTDTGGNWTAGSVTLTDDDGSGSVAFTNDAAMVPGDTDQACIAVTYGGDVAASVKMYGSTTTTTATNLGDYLTLTIEDVTIVTDCASATVNTTLFSGADLAVSGTSFSVLHTAWGDGLSTGWTPSASATKTFRITVQLQDDNAAQALDTTATFTWEAQNT